MRNEEIIKNGQETFAEFLKMLDGPEDIYKQIVLEELFKFISDEYYKIPGIPKPIDIPDISIKT